MTPAAIALIVQLLQLAITEEPAIQAQLTALFAKANPTPADWEALRTTVLAKSYAQLVPDTKLPAADLAA